MTPYKILIFVGIGVILVLGVVVGLSISRVSIATQEYEIFIDPFKDEQSLFVMVTADEGILVNKAFRTPSKMPGMMGS